ncbi:AfsR/SARP family transcriptional regulator [Nonomuraea harbinensis]|uniref:BTAD domain-containing putative transcriptional regulator n=1 Tax=Nonomuraea harbinensis TaxID=1286938 RepID=A0ABW1BVF1_9ACTN|nr:BTAD domain-containing putative transcriptional regulator [Nonomuraea harbinensis]
MRFEILGPTEVLGDDGTGIPVGGPRVRALLALLALEPGRVVGADQLVDGLYGEEPPEGVANALQSQVSRLRRALGRDRVEFHPAGYRLVADPMDVDASRFEWLAAEGRRALGSGDAGRASALLREGLELWRGAPLADAPHAGASAARLSELRLTAIEDRTQADLELGRHRELAAELRRLVADHPLRERLRAQLMRALYGSGRQAEALTAYAEGRRILDDQLGIQPGPELAAAHLAVLRADPALGLATLPLPPLTPTSPQTITPRSHDTQPDTRGPQTGGDHDTADARGAQHAGSGPWETSHTDAQHDRSGGTHREHRPDTARPAADRGDDVRFTQLDGRGAERGAGGAGRGGGGAGRGGGGAGRGGGGAGRGGGGPWESVEGSDGGRVWGGPGGGAADVGGGVSRGVWSGGAGVKVGVRAQLSSFVGRGEELRQVSRELGASRLVTLVGAGGAGKTRLALEVAERADGDVCLVQLAPVTADAEVAPAVLAALGIRDRHGPELPDPVERLVTALAGRELLLILDNSEHVVEAAARLADTLLGSCPGLRVLATSREALGITGESLVPVSPLRLPPPDARDPLGYPAVRLFADRAAAVRPAFAVTPENVEQVVRICHALDGLPLAIELAAARLRTLSVAEVAARLDDRFRLLARGSRTALPRHQTLRAVVAWSWDLLDEDEQRMAGRLTVFAGGATAEAAERVCGLPEEVLFSLAEKSLVEAVDGRYRMLETIRAFCAERLAEAGEAETMREAHAAHYLDLAITADNHLRRAEQLEWLARLDAESDDLNAAVRWATESGRLETALRLLAYCACYWWMRGHRTVSTTLAAELLERVGDAAPDGLKEEYAMCVLVAAWTGVGDDWLAERLEGLRPSLPTDYMPAKLEFLTLLLAMFTGPPEGVATPSQLRALTAAVPMSPWSTALTGCGYGFMLQESGEPERAGAEFERSLAAFRAMGERWGTMLALSGLADLAAEQEDHVTTLARAKEAMEVARQLGALADVAESLCRCADALARTGDPERARTDYERAAELSRRVGSTDILARAHCGLGEVALAVGDLAAARTWLERAREECPAGWYSVNDLRERIAAALAAVSGR